MGATVYDMGPKVTVWLNDADGRTEDQPLDVLDRINEEMRLACDEVAKRFICPEQGIDVMVL